LDEWSDKTATSANTAANSGADFFAPKMPEVDNYQDFFETLSNTFSKTMGDPSTNPTNSSMPGIHAN